VTTEQPLTIVVDQSPAAGERVLAVASDGEDHLPLGVGRPAADGRLELRLTRLPQPTPEGTRSLGGSLKLLFRKLVLRRLGVDDPYPLLSLVRYDGNGVPETVHDRAAVRAAVTGAGRVLLLVHGIIGDTRGMTRCVGSGPEPLHTGYDAVLAFDYENLHTGIDEIAGLLRDRLADAGLGAGTRVDVVAHSMGGLVARWYVEHGGGAAHVDRLVTCGTPHRGSPWPRVEDVAVTALAFGLNRLADLSGVPGVAATVLGFLVQGVERVDVSLDQMTPGSPILTALANSDEPDVPYVVIAGEHPFGSAADPDRVARLLRKLRVPGAVLDALFDGRPHDIAVSVESATAVGRSWQQLPRVSAAGCSHLSYFSSPEGVAALRAALVSGR
jgi:pimeloyl-ACP methyl ester carboxylesterase